MKKKEGQKGNYYISNNYKVSLIAKKTMVSQIKYGQHHVSIWINQANTAKQTTCKVPTFFFSSSSIFFISFSEENKKPGASHELLISFIVGRWKPITKS
jgi:hypothetical protein